MDCWHIPRGQRPRVPQQEGSMTADTLVLDTLADLTAALVEHNSFAALLPCEFMLARLPP